MGIAAPVENLPPVATVVGAQTNPNTAPTAHGRQAGGTQEGQVAPPQPAKWKLENMGRPNAGEIARTEDVKKLYKPLAIQTATRIKQFQADGHTLTVEQQKFLDLYEKDQTCETMLATESGMMAAHVAIETQLFLDLIAMGRQMDLSFPNHRGRPVQLNLNLPQYQGWLTRFGAGFENVVNNLSAIFGDPTRNGRIDITAAAGIDLNNLPPAYQDYVQWAQVGIDEAGMAKQFLETAAAQLEFYKALKVDPLRLNTLNHWQLLNLTQDETAPLRPQDFAQNFVAAWTRTRMDKFRQLGGFTDVLTSAQKIERFFKAQVATVEDYTNRRLTEINRGVGTSRYTRTIETLNQRKGTLSTSQLPERERRKRSEELTQKQAQLQSEKGEFAQNQTRIGAIDSELQTIADEEVELNRERGDLGTSIPPLEADRDRIVRDQRDARVQYLARRAAAQAANNAGLVAQEETTWNEMTNRDFNERLAAIDQQLTTQRNRRSAIDSRLGSRTTLRNERTRLDARNTQITNGRAALETRIDTLEDELAAGMSPANKERAARFDAAVQALGRSTAIFEDLNDTAKRQEYMPDKLTSADPHPTLKRADGTAINKGYARFLDLVFDLSHPPAGMTPADYLLRAMEVMPEDALADFLQIHFNLTVGLGGGNRLEQVYTALRTRGMTPGDLYGAMNSVLNGVEQTSLLI